MRYRGPVAWFPDADVPGFYALTEDGKRPLEPVLHLIAVQPRWRQKHYYRIAQPGERTPPPDPSRIVELEIDAVGKGDVTA
jgi:hypothetical protein